MVVCMLIMTNNRRVHYGTGDNTGDRSCKECGLRPWRRWAWERRRQKATHPAEGAAVCRPTLALSHWDGSRGECTLLGTRVEPTRPYGEIDALPVCQTIRAEPEK